MRCPRCVQDLVSAVPQCEHCGFSLSALDDVYGAENVFLDRLTDTAHCLRPRQTERVDRALDRFERAFPQLFAAVYIGFLPEGSDLRQFGFWLLNRASVTSVDLGKPNRLGLLLTVDLASQSAGITPGYGIEPFVSERDLIAAIESARPTFVAGNHGRAIEKTLSSVTTRLRRRVTEYRAHPKRFLDARGWEVSDDRDLTGEGEHALG